MPLYPCFSPACIAPAQRWPLTARIANAPVPLIALQNAPVLNNGARSAAPQRVTLVVTAVGRALLWPSALAVSRLWLVASGITSIRVRSWLDRACNPVDPGVVACAQTWLATLNASAGDDYRAEDEA
jgi:hypothetical protein